MKDTGSKGRTAGLQIALEPWSPVMATSPKDSLLGLVLSRWGNL